jgi:hypothetical protein
MDRVEGLPKAKNTSTLSQPALIESTPKRLPETRIEAAIKEVITSFQLSDEVLLLSIEKLRMESLNLQDIQEFDAKRISRLLEKVGIVEEECFKRTGGKPDDRDVKFVVYEIMKAVFRTCATVITTSQDQDKMKYCSLLNKAALALPLDEIPFRKLDINCFSEAIKKQIEPTLDRLAEIQFKAHTESDERVSRESLQRDLQRKIADLASTKKYHYTQEGIELVDREGSHLPVIFQKLREAIVEFFGHIGKSSNARRGSDYLITLIEGSLKQMSPFSPETQQQEIDLLTICAPLFVHKWFLSTLRNNVQLQNRFDSIRCRLDSKVDEAISKLERSTERSLSDQRALEALRKIRLQ